jgi:hypothetical protein
MLDFNLSSGCEHCSSPFHSSQDCDEKEMPRYKTRKKLGLKSGEVPFKFRVEVNPEVDGEVEVVRKRALLKLNSERVYTQMGCAAKAHTASVETNKWLLRMLEHCDAEEKIQLAPLLEGLALIQVKLAHIRDIKVDQSVKMEEVLTEAYKQSRKVRKVVASKKSNKLKKSADFSIPKLPQALGAIIPLPPDTVEAFSIFEDRRLALEERKASYQREYPSQEQ